MSLVGDYSEHECGIMVTNVSATADLATWECDMEQYVFGDWVSGDRHSVILSVDFTTLKKPMTTPTPPITPVMDRDMSGDNNTAETITKNNTDLLHTIHNVTSFIDTTLEIVRLDTLKVADEGEDKSGNVAKVSSVFIIQG